MVRHVHRASGHSDDLADRFGGHSGGAQEHHMAHPFGERVEQNHRRAVFSGGDGAVFRGRRRFHLLGLLHDRGRITQRELGALMDVDPSVLVTLLNPLEADGFVSRERDPIDRRRHVVMLTAAGQRHFDNARRAQREAENALFAGLDDDQRQQLSAVLVALRDSLTSGHEDVCSPPEANEDC